MSAAGTETNSMDRGSPPKDSTSVCSAPSPPPPQVQPSTAAFPLLILDSA